MVSETGSVDLVISRSRVSSDFGVSEIGVFPGYIFVNSMIIVGLIAGRIKVWRVLVN